MSAHRPQGDARPDPRVPDRSTLLNVSAGWHTHLDILAARIAGLEPKPFWDEIGRLKPDYDRRTLA